MKYPVPICCAIATPPLRRGKDGIPPFKEEPAPTIRGDEERGGGLT